MCSWRTVAVALLLVQITWALPKVQFRSLVRHSPHRRSVAHADLSVRQTSCTSSCTSASDETELNALNACSSTDVGCECDALEALSAACLSCVLAENDVTTAEYQAECAPPTTTTQCSTQCADAADTAADNALGECSVGELGDPCVCEALADMSSTCLDCLLTAADLTVQDYDQSCLGGPGSPTSTSSSPPASTATSASCTSSCSDASDQAVLQAGSACSATDIACVCQALAELSSACLSCELAESGVTPSEYESECSAPISPTFTGGGGAATSIASSTTSTKAATPTPTTATCGTQCSSTSDQAAIAEVDSCASGNTECTCNALTKLSATCLSCELTANGITQAQYDEVCASPPPTTAPTSQIPFPTGTSSTPTTTATPHPTQASDASGMHGALGGIVVAAFAALGAFVL